MRSICSHIHQYWLRLRYKSGIWANNGIKQQSFIFHRNRVLRQLRYLSSLKKSLYNLRPEALRPNFSISLPNTVGTIESRQVNNM